MIILDTNVVSALMQPTQHAIVIDWLNRQRRSSIYATSITLLEIRYGIKILPRGRRRETLDANLNTIMAGALDGRILPFDAGAAEVAADIAALRQARGRNVPPPDTQIAGIVASRHARLATRNIKDFEDIDIELVNPWTD